MTQSKVYSIHEKSGQITDASYSSNWRGVINKPIAPRTAPINSAKYFILGYVVEDTKVVVANPLGTCKAYIDDVVHGIHTGLSEKDVYDFELTGIKNVVTQQQKGCVWQGKDNPLIVGWVTTYQMPQSEIEFVRDVVRIFEENLGIKTPIAILPTTHNTSLVLYRVSKKWISSSYMVSLLTWIMRFASYTTDANGIDRKGNKVDYRKSCFWDGKQSAIQFFDELMTLSQTKRQQINNWGDTTDLNIWLTPVIDTFKFFRDNGLPRQLSTGFSHGEGAYVFYERYLEFKKLPDDWKLPSSNTLPKS